MTLDDFRARLQADLVRHLRARDRAATAVVRTLAAALANAEAVDSGHGAEPVPFGTAEAPRREISLDDAIEIVRNEVEERTSVLAEYDRHPDAGHAERLRAEIEVLERYRSDLEGA